MTNKEHQAIDRFITDHIRKIAAAREQACEEMLQRDEGGVLELQHTDGSVEFFVTNGVPYGHIYEWNENLAGPFPWELPPRAEAEE